MTTSHEGLAQNATIDDEYTLHAETIDGGVISVSYDPETDSYTGYIDYPDGRRFQSGPIGCPSHPLDPDESSVNNLLQVADIVIGEAIGN